MTLESKSAKRSLAARFCIGVTVVLFMVAGRVSAANAQSPQPIGVQITSPAVANNCLVGSCTTHSPLAFNASVQMPYESAPFTLSNGDTYRINGVIGLSDENNGFFVPGVFDITVTLVSGSGAGGASVGAPDTIVIDSYLDWTQANIAYNLGTGIGGSFSSGVAAGSTISIGGNYCGVHATVIGPLSDPPTAFNQFENVFVSSCQTDGFLADNTLTFTFQSGSQPGSYIVDGTAGKVLTSTHDFNGDSYSDIVLRDSSGNNAMWLMNGASILANAGVGNLPIAWSIVGQRDFNGDGKADLLWHDTSGDIGIWFMDGTTLSSSVGLGTVNPVWSVAGTGDFNGDGMGDILWRDTSGDIAIWLMNGATIKQAAGLGTLSTSWSIVGTGDFNGDGNWDILWQDTSGDLAIWFMNGTTVSSGVGLGTIAPPWTIVGTGDFNGDGKSDILWRNTSTGAIAVWLMNGSTILSAAGLGNISTVWSIAETGDFNGDGQSDILWNDTSGDVAIWFMNGTTVLSSAGLGTIPKVWSIPGAGAD